MRHRVAVTPSTCRGVSTSLAGSLVRWARAPHLRHVWLESFHYGPVAFLSHVLLVFAIAFLSKLVGAGLAALWTGLSRKESLAVGIGMSARGAVELIIADVALGAGLFDHPEPPPPIIQHLFSAVVIVAVLTTVAIPIALRHLLAEEKVTS